MYESSIIITLIIILHYFTSISWNAFTFALDSSTSTELMSGAKSRKWVHQKPTNQPTNQNTTKDIVYVRQLHTVGLMKMIS